MAILVNGKKVAGIGAPGADGKSAYQAAVEGGYTGSESEFNQILASAATESYVDSKLPIGRTVTLSSSGWSSNSQTVTVEGVNAYTVGQKIDWGAHDQDSYTALTSAQLFVSDSTSANQLVFTALGEVPTSDVNIDICITPILFNLTWGDETAVGDQEWWATLKAWARSASASERQACVGKTKKVSLSSAVLGANQALMRCIGYDLDGEGTLAFQTAGTLPNSLKFDKDSAAWIGSNARTQCRNFASYCSASNSITTVNKGTCPSTNESRNGTATYNSETGWLPSEREMGLDEFSPLSTANSSTVNAECTQGYNASYQYYDSNSDRIKYGMDASGNVGSTTRSYWERSCQKDHSVGVCCVNTIGIASGDACFGNFHLAPAFVI